MVGLSKIISNLTLNDLKLLGPRKSQSQKNLFERHLLNPRVKLLERKKTFKLRVQAYCQLLQQKILSLRKSFLFLSLDKDKQKKVSLFECFKISTILPLHDKVCSMINPRITFHSSLE